MHLHFQLWFLNAMLFSGNDSGHTSCEKEVPKSVGVALWPTHPLHYPSQTDKVKSFKAVSQAETAQDERVWLHFKLQPQYFI